MKHFTCTLALLFLHAMTVNAQSQNKTTPPGHSPKISLTTGVGMNVIGVAAPYPTFHTGIETNLNTYTALGFQYVALMRTDLGVYTEVEVSPGSFELGLYVKRFLSGKWSGRKSGLFTGADIRFGSYKYVQDPFSSSYQWNNQKLYYSSGHTYRIMFLTGYRLNYGRAFLEIDLPFGISFNKMDKVAFSSGDYTPRKGAIAPIICLGFSF